MAGKGVETNLGTKLHAPRLNGGIGETNRTRGAIFDAGTAR